MAGLPSRRKKGVRAPENPCPSAYGIVEGAETVTWSYRTPSGTTGGAVHGSRTVPTASERAREIPGTGKGLKKCYGTCENQTVLRFCYCLLACWLLQPL